MKTLFNLFTILVIWLCIDGLNGDASGDGLCEVCSDSNDPNCLEVELKQCTINQPYCMDAYFEPSFHVRSPNGRLIKQCGSLVCPSFNGTEADLCDSCINTLKDKCNMNKTIDYYIKRLVQIRIEEAKEEPAWKAWHERLQAKLNARKLVSSPHLPKIETLEPYRPPCNYDFDDWKPARSPQQPYVENWEHYLTPCNNDRRYNLVPY